MSHKAVTGASLLLQLANLGSSWSSKLGTVMDDEFIVVSSGRKWGGFGGGLWLVVLTADGD